MNIQESDWWLHLSFSYSKKIPSWEDTTWVKDKFIGDQLEAIVKIPKRSEYVNVHKFCLHLWCPLSNPRFTPDFRLGGMI